MCYEKATQINRIKWHYWINGEFHSVQNMDKRLFFLKNWIHLQGLDLRSSTSLEVLEEEVFNESSEKQIYVLALH